MLRSRSMYLSDGYETRSPAVSPPPPSTRSVKFLQPPQTHHHRPESDYDSDNRTSSWVKRLAATTALPSQINLDKSLEHPALVSLARSQTHGGRLRKRPSGSLTATRARSRSPMDSPVPTIESSMLLSPPPSNDVIYTQYNPYSPYHQQRQPPPPPMPRPSSMRSDGSSYSSRPNSLYSHSRGTPSTSTIASTAATSVASSNPPRKLSSSNWVVTRSVNTQVLDQLANPHPSPSPSSRTHSAFSPGTTPKYLSAIGSYLNSTSVSPDSSSRPSLSRVSDPFDYASEKRREEQLPSRSGEAQKHKDRDSLERIRVAELNKSLPHLPLPEEKKSERRAPKPQHSPYLTEDPPAKKLDKGKERARGERPDPAPILKSSSKPQSRKAETPLSDSELSYLRLARTPAPQEDPVPSDSGHARPVPPRNPRRRPTLDPLSTETRPPPSSFVPPVLSPVTPLRIKKLSGAPSPPVIQAYEPIKSSEDVWKTVQSLRMVLLREEDYSGRFVDHEDDLDNEAVMSLDALKRTMVW